MLGRLRIRGKLALLVTIPLLAMLGLLVPQMTRLFNAADQASETDLVAKITGQVGVLVEDLQQERLLSIGYLLNVVDTDDLTRQSAEVANQIGTVRRTFGAQLPAELRASLDLAQQLDQLRQRVLSKSATPDELIDGFVPVLDGMIESLGLDEFADLTTATGRELVTLEAVLNMNESLTESTAILAVMAAGNAETQSVRYHSEQTEREIYEERFAAYATPAQTQLYDQVSAAFQERLGPTFDDDFDLDPVAAMRARPLATLFPSLVSFSVLGGSVEKRLIDDLSASVSRVQRQAVTLAYGLGIGAILLLILVLVLVAVLGRAVAGPLIQLTRSAERVAEAGEEELRRIADDEAEGDAPARLEALDISSNDEIGELARAFDRLQSTATQLVERQVLSRRNVAQMFGHIGRRTQNLVGRQVDLIDQLEKQETDGPRLQQLYRLDHLSNRLRRTADSLVVISGSDRGEDHLSPVRLVDVARLALAEIEEYTRVDMDVPIDLVAAPAVVSDLVLLVGELLENATNFSPPHTRVSIAARAVPGGARIVVVDRGLGMSDERLAEENARFTRRERLDLAPTRVLGLFVVGRVARRHGFGVVLAGTPGGGVTATVDIDDAYLTGGRAGDKLQAGGHDRHAAADRQTPGIADRQTPGIAELEAMLTTAPARDVVARHAAAATPRATTYQAGAGVAPFAAEPVRRAGDRMGDLQPWNAFDVVPRSPADGRAAGRPATVDAGRHDERPAAGPGAPVPAVPASPSGLRQRVPGQQSPIISTPTVSSAPPSSAEASAARDLIETFEAGVRRAEEVTGVLPRHPGPAAEATPPAWPLMSAGGGVYAASSSASPPMVAAASAPPAPVPPPAGPAGARTLRRRTPGATLDTEATPRRSDPPPSASDHDPEAVRSLVEQYESGVARALRDTSADTEMGTSG